MLTPGFRIRVLLDEANDYEKNPFSSRGGRTLYFAPGHLVLAHAISASFWICSDWTLLPRVLRGGVSRADVVAGFAGVAVTSGAGS